MSRKAFKTWIKKFNKEDSPIGDLARDIKNDNKFPIGKNFIKMHSYLQSINASNNAIDVYKKAFRLFEQEYVMYSKSEIEAALIRVLSENMCISDEQATKLRHLIIREIQNPTKGK